MPEATAVRDALVAYTSDEPPPAFTLDEVRTAGRRARRRRLALVSVAAAVTVVTGVTVAAVTLTAAPEIHAVHPVRTGPDPTPYCRAAATAAPAPPPAPTMTVNPLNRHPLRILTEPRDRAVNRLTCAVMSRVTAMLPDATYTSRSEPLSEPLRMYPGPYPLETGRSPQDTTSYGATAIIEHDGVSYSLSVALSPTPRPLKETIGVCEGQPECAVLTDTDDRIVTYQSGSNSPGDSWATIQAHTEDTAVIVALNGYDGPGTPHVESLLSPAQLVELASAPELTLFP